MLESLTNYSNLGTVGYFWELFRILEQRQTWTKSSIAKHFFNRVIDGKSAFDGCIPLMLYLRAISVSTEGAVCLEPHFQGLRNESDCQAVVLKRLLLRLKDEGILIKALSEGGLDYDVVHKTLRVNAFVFGFRYANLRHLLIDLEFLLPHPALHSDALIVNSKWSHFFNEHFTPAIRKRTVSPEEVMQRQHTQRIHGELAEQFVLKFEKNRLNKKDGVEWIAAYDASAGFDILSFQDATSGEHDLFIEVKCYEGNTPYFYWTKNEMKKAHDYKKSYSLYLVNRRAMCEDNYTPIIIPNPSETVLRDDKWEKEVDKYYITTAR